MEDEYIKKLIIARLKTMPPNVSFSIGGHGTFTKDQLINEVKQETELGQETVKTELRFIREMPKIANWLQTQ